MVWAWNCRRSEVDEDGDEVEDEGEELQAEEEAAAAAPAPAAASEPQVKRRRRGRPASCANLCRDQRRNVQGRAPRNSPEELGSAGIVEGTWPKGVANTLISALHESTSDTFTSGFQTDLTAFKQFFWNTACRVMGC